LAHPVWLCREAPGEVKASAVHRKRIEDAGAELNAVYKAALACAPSKEAHARLREAQRAWIALRDANAALEEVTGYMRNIVAATIFRIIQIILLPIGAVAYVVFAVKLVTFSRRSGTSATVLASLYTRYGCDDFSG